MAVSQRSPLAKVSLNKPRRRSSSTASTSTTTSSSSASLRNGRRHRVSAASSKSSASSSKRQRQRKSIGRWQPWERLAFLRGLRMYGRGKWKVIATLIPTRDTIQVKTHAQVMLRKLDNGTNIFEELDNQEEKQEEEPEQQHPMSLSSTTPHHEQQNTDLPFTSPALISVFEGGEAEKYDEEEVPTTLQNEEFAAAQTLLELSKGSY